MVILMGLTIMILAPIMAIGGIIMAIRQDIPLSGCWSSSCRSWRSSSACSWRAPCRCSVMQVKIDRINQVTREALTGVRVIRAFVRTTTRRSASRPPTTT